MLPAWDVVSHIEGARGRKHKWVQGLDNFPLVYSPVRAKKIPLWYVAYVHGGQGSVYFHIFCQEQRKARGTKKLQSKETEREAKRTQTKSPEQ